MNTKAITMNPHEDDLIVKFQEDCELRDLVSTRDYVSRAEEFSTFLAKRGKDVQEGNKEDLKAFLRHLKKRPIKFATIDRIFVCISSFYAFLIDDGLIEHNPILPFRRRYLRNSRKDSNSETRKLITIEDASKLVNSILDTRDKAIMTLLFKTGVRVGELCSLDISDVDIENGEIQLKSTAKRSNLRLFIDQETIAALSKWLKVRKTRRGSDKSALFISRKGVRLCTGAVRNLVIKHATRVGLHDPSSVRLKDRFTPHCCRHWFTTYLMRAGMSKDYVKELRGDSRREAIDIYHHIDREELRESYLAHIPQLGI